MTKKKENDLLERIISVLNPEEKEQLYTKILGGILNEPIPEKK